jgi:centrosomal protein CEP76
LQFLKHCLPADLLSKGCIVFECWNQEETSSDFLGGCEVHLSALAKQTTQEYRCLAEGFKEKTLEGSRMADGKPIVFQYKVVFLMPV